jgi:hypothetical protein
MAEIELIIRISEEDYERIKNSDDMNFNVIKNGIPLPKQHGKIIDADSIPSYRIRGVTEYCRGYNDRTAEIENAIVNATAILK